MNDIESFGNDDNRGFPRSNRPLQKSEREPKNLRTSTVGGAVASSPQGCTRSTASEGVAEPPFDTNSCETTFPEQMLSEQTPSDQTPSDQTLSHRTPSDHTPSDHTPSDHAPSDHAPSNRTSSDQQPSEQNCPEQELHKQESAKQEPAKQGPAKQEFAKQEPARQEPAKQEPTRQELAEQKLPEHVPHDRKLAGYLNASPLCCSRCEELATDNEQLLRRVARLQQRLRDATETAQTHGQRLLRAAFQEKVRELTKAHSIKTTEMLNIQKKCFEEELEAMDAESQAASLDLQRELEVERGMRAEAEERYKREREAALEKTTATMVAVQRKMTQLHARVTRLEREKKSLAGTVSEKQVMIEVLASAAAAKDVERKRVELLARSREEERKRKDGMIERLEKESLGLRERLAVERKVNLNLLGRIEGLEGRENGKVDKVGREDTEEGEGKRVNRGEKLYSSVIEGLANAQSDVSTNE